MVSYPEEDEHRLLDVVHILVCDLGEDVVCHLVSLLYRLLIAFGGDTCSLDGYDAYVYCNGA